MDPARLARFVDGTLDPAERSAVMRILATSAADREVLADMVRELGEAAEEDEPVPGPKRPPPTAYMLI